MFRRPMFLLRAFARCRSGVAAVEFALIAPLMIATYYGSAELCNVLLADRKVTNVCAATTDLVAQATQLDNTQIGDIFEASSAIMEPYQTASLQIVVSSVVADQNGNTTIAWSDSYGGGAHAAGSDFALPDGLLLPGASVIVTEVSYTYTSPFGDLMRSGITLHDRFYERPRKVLQITRVP
jgi:Flp pilus assembly protein TadG